MNLTLLIIVLILYSLYLYFYVGIIISKKIKVCEFNISYKNIKNIKMVQLSDIHIRDKSLKYLEEIVKRINKIEADIILFTGDLFDEDINNNKRMMHDSLKLLKKIKQKNKIAVLGNHDCINNNYVVDKTLSESGFKILRDEVFDLEINNKFVKFVGVSSIYDKPKYDFIDDIDDDFMLLAHEPDIIDKIKNIHLKYQFSGHTHGGQIVLFPFLFRKGIKGGMKYKKRFQRVDNTYLFINYGIGNSSIDFSMYKRKELNLYNFR